MHGQVSLVLEYCDLGSLRDALDGGAFALGEASLQGGLGESQRPTVAGTECTPVQPVAILPPCHDTSDVVCVFFGPAGDDRGPCGDGINYAAVLDTAIDVARAMVHLHKQSVSGRDITTPCFCIGGAECMHRVLPEVCKVLGARTHEY